MAALFILLVYRISPFHTREMVTMCYRNLNFTVKLLANIL